MLNLRVFIIRVNYIVNSVTLISANSLLFYIKIYSLIMKHVITPEHFDTTSITVTK